MQVAPDFEREYPDARARATECYANVVRTGDMLIGMHNRETAVRYGLSPAARMALAVVEGAGEPLEPSVIAERLIITTGSMTSLLDTLEKRGLIRRMPHPDDRRKLLVDITLEAVTILNELLPSLHQRERHVMDDALTPTEQLELLRLIAKVQASARAHADDPPARGARRVRPRRPTKH